MSNHSNQTPQKDDAESDDLSGGPSSREENLRRECALFQRNDPKTTSVWADEDEWPVGYVRPLGESLINNTFVSEIWLNVNDMVFIADREEANDEDIEAADVEAAPLLQFFRASPTLRKVSLNEGKEGGHWVTDHVCGGILSAMADNPHDTIVELVVASHVLLEPEDFYHLLSTTRSLRVLEMYLGCLYFETTQEGEIIAAEAFGANQTLEKICLSQLEEQAVVLTNRILMQLISHPKLEHFELEVRPWDCFPIPYALPVLFRSNQNANLRQVNLSNHCFSETSWLEVVDALQLNTSLERLDLDRCTFKAEAVKCFIQTFQPQKSTNKVKPVRQDNVLISLTSLEPDMFEGTAFTMVLAGVWSCSSPRNNRGRRPILKQKDASQVYTKSCFQIASIILCALDEAELDALSECLSHATHLRKLSISTIRNCGSRTVFESVVRAIRNNGSLHRVDLHSGTRDSERWPYFPLFDATQQRLIQAYCERNQAASSLLSASRLNDADGQCRDSALSLVAPVFVTANPAWRTAPNTFLVGLSAAADPTVLGPSHRVDKRILQRDTDIQS